MTRHRTRSRRSAGPGQHAWKRHLALLSICLLIGAALTACARNPEPHADAESAAADSAGQSVGTSTASQEVELTGRVVNSGTDRFTITTLQVTDAPSTRLTGELVDELRTLAGADVTVRGTIEPSGSGRSLDVREYQLLAIEGKRPRVGRVLLREGGVWLAAVDTLQLVPALDALRNLVGAKIWVVGATRPGEAGLRVESYGVIARAR